MVIPWYTLKYHGSFFILPCKEHNIYHVIHLVCSLYCGSTTQYSDIALRVWMLTWPCACVSEGGPNPEFNVALAQLLEQCRNRNLPKATVEGAIKGAVRQIFFTISPNNINDMIKEFRFLPSYSSFFSPLHSWVCVFLQILHVGCIYLIKIQLNIV